MDYRLFGKVDYKRARYVFHPEYAVRQALFVDSKAEKADGKNTATLQISQLSMIVRQHRSGKVVEEAGKMPKTLSVNDQQLLTTTVFVKYNYEEVAPGDKKLVNIIIAALPNGFLQEKYTPSADDTIFLAGRDAPTLGEAFRVRLSFSRLRKKADWRVQEIDLVNEIFNWQD